MQISFQLVYDAVMHSLDIAWLVLLSVIALQTLSRFAFARGFDQFLDESIRLLRSEDQMDRIRAAYMLFTMAVFAGPPYSGMVSSWAVPMLKKEMLSRD